MLALHLQHEPSEMTLDQQCRVVCLSDMLLDTNKVAWPMDAAMGSPIVDVGSGMMDRPSADAGRMTKAAAMWGMTPTMSISSSSSVKAAIALASTISNVPVTNLGFYPTVSYASVSPEMS